MNLAGEPILVIHDSNELATEARFLDGKCLVSSLQRSLFTGRILVLRVSATRLFRVPRTSIEELVMPTMGIPENERVSRQRAINYLSVGHDFINAATDQWVIVANSAGLSLRNIDHLFHSISFSNSESAKLHFLWAETEIKTKCRSQPSASPGLWAVRGGCLTSVLEMWMSVENRVSGIECASQIWSEVVSALPLRKRPFEKGEVYAPLMGSVDWEAVSNAAFVTVPDWPEKEQWKFLQALYFGTYFGDETGLMLNILDP